jgi:hypothetical protein
MAHARGWRASAVDAKRQLPGWNGGAAHAGHVVHVYAQRSQRLIVRRACEVREAVIPSRTKRFLECPPSGPMRQNSGFS